MTQDQGLLETIDIIGVRALFDRHGAQEAARLVRCMAKADDQRLPSLDRPHLSGRPATFSREGGHGVIGCHLDDRGDWWCEANVVRIERIIAANLPDTILNTIEGRPVTDLLGHPHLDPGMIVESVTQGVTGDIILVLTRTRRSLRDVVGLMMAGERP